MSNRHSLYLILFIIVFFTTAASQVLLATSEDYWGDEGFSVRRIETSWQQIYDPISNNQPVCNDPFDTTYVFDLNPPLYFALVRSIAGPHPSRLTLRLFSIIPMLATLILLGWWAYRRHGIIPATVILLAFCLSPPMIYYGHEARPYALGLFISALLVLAFERPSAHPSIVFGINFILSFAGVLTHYHLVWLLVTLAALYAVRPWLAESRGARMQSLAGVGGIGLGTSAAILGLMPVWYTFGMAKNMPSRGVEFSSALRTIFLPLMSQNSHDRVQLSLSLCAVVLFCGMAIYSIRKSRAGGAWLALWIIPCIAPMAGRLLLGQVFFERYAIFTVPAWMMLLAWIFRKDALQSGIARTCAGLLTLAIVLNGAFWVIKHHDVPLRTPWHSTIASFYAAQQPGDYYAIEPDWLASCFAANAGQRPDATYLPALAQIPAGANRIWIFEQVNYRQSVAGMFVNAGWHVKPAGRDVGYRLWRVDKTPQGK